eukprot:15436184-Alexandrium_andersonii.AAC.1
MVGIGSSARWRVWTRLQSKPRQRTEWSSPGPDAARTLRSPSSSTQPCGCRAKRIASTAGLYD